MPKSIGRDRAVITPRGLSRIQAAEYIGVSTSFFDQLVAEGKMPRPKHVGSRRIWDRWAVDDAFEDLGIAEGSPLEDWKASENDEREFEERMEALSKIKGKLVLHRGAMMSEDDFREGVLAKPMGRLEQKALLGLHARRGDDVKWDEIKGAGGTTQTMLEVRGYVKITNDGDSFVSWCITEAGVAAVEAGLASQP